MKTVFKGCLHLGAVAVLAMGSLARAQIVTGPSPEPATVPEGIDVFSLSLEQTRQYSNSQNFEVVGHEYFKIPERSAWARALGRTGPETGAGLSSVKVSNGIAYIGGYNSPPTLFGVIIADVHDSLHMKKLAFIPCKARTRCPYVDLDARRMILVIGNDTFRDPRRAGEIDPDAVNAEAGFSFYDVSRPDAPRELAFLPTLKGGLTHGFAVADNYLYGCAQLHPDSFEMLTIVDYSDPRHPHPVSEWHVAGMLKGETPEPMNRPSPDGKQQVLRCHEVVPFHNRLYAAWRDAGMKVFDIKDPAQPRLLATYDYVPPYKGGILGATHTTLPIIVGKQEDPDLVVLADEIYDCPPGFGRILDVSDLKNPQVLAAERSPSFQVLSTFRLAELDDRIDSSRQFVCPGDKINTPFATVASSIHSPIQDLSSPSLLLVTWYNAGLRAVDISNPYAPKFVGYYVSPKYAAWGNDDRRTREVGQDPSTNLIYITDGNGGGLTVLRYTGPIPKGRPLPGAR